VGVKLGLPKTIKMFIFKCFDILNPKAHLVKPLSLELMPSILQLFMFTISHGSFTLSICSKNFGSSFLIRYRIIIFDFVL